MRAIFISYRREDSEGQAGRLFDDLSAHFGKDSVFMDVAGIEPGRDFRRAIDEQVATCGVLLAMIGKGWTDAKDESGRRRLDDPMDFVRLETASALKRDIPVIPVLVHGAHMPRADQLPQDLADLAYRNGVELTHPRWDSDVQVLIKALSPYVESVPKKAGGVDTASSSGTASVAKKRLPMIAAASLAAIIVAVGGYAWYRAASQKAETRAALVEEAVRFTAAAEKEKAVAAEKEKAAADAQEAEKRARRKIDATPQPFWSSHDFPPPNAGLVVFTIMPDGNPACASYDAGRCLWGVTADQIDFSRLKPLVCGEQHRARWGVSGYEDPKHWCNLAKQMRNRSSGTPPLHIPQQLT